MAQDQTPREGGITTNDTPVNSPSDVFSTEGNKPVRDKSPDGSKGTPVKRFFTKDGTPVEPSTVPGAVTPSNLSGHDASKRPDIVEAWEYLGKDGSTLTNDGLKAAQDADKDSSESSGTASDSKASTGTTVNNI